MRLILCGGGHVARALAPIGLSLGFAVTVLDDRAEFADPARFPGCETVCGPFVEGLSALGGRGDDFYCVLTRGHRYDQACVAHILRGEFAYLGMMGSRAKVAATREALAGQGFSPQALSRLHAPIGLKVGGSSPAEIAVEIAAELVQIRAGLGGEGAPPPPGPGVLCTVVEKAGSAPRGPGAWMLVAPDGTIAGTVGGGALEGQVIRDALALWAAGGKGEERRYDLGGGLGMACGGQVTLRLRRRDGEAPA